MTNFIPFEREAFEDPQLDPWLQGGNALMQDTTWRHEFKKGKLDYIHAEAVVKECQPKECPTTSVFYNADKPGNGKKDMQGMQRITVALARTPVDHPPSWRSERSVLLNPSWWEMMWLACAKFYGTVANLEASFAQARTKDSARNNATAQPLPLPSGKGGSTKVPKTSTGNTPPFFWCMVPSAPPTHRPKMEMTCRETT